MLVYSNSNDNTQVIAGYNTTITHHFIILCMGLPKKESMAKQRQQLAKVYIIIKLVSTL